MHTYLASEIVTGMVNLDLMRDFIFRTIRILCGAVECSGSNSKTLRASYNGYEWHVEYKNAEVGKSWSILCYKKIDNGLCLVFSHTSGALSDEYTSGVYATMNELVIVFTSHFPAINPRLETLRYASTIRI